jgi:hypothetical protein
MKRYAIWRYYTLAIRESEVLQVFTSDIIKDCLGFQLHIGFMCGVGVEWIQILVWRMVIKNGWLKYFAQSVRLMLGHFSKTGHECLHS